MRYIRVLGAIAVAGGAIIVAAAFLVEYTRFSDDPGLGLRQILGIILGVSAVASGVFLLLGRRRESLAVIRVLGIVFLAGGSLMLLASLLGDILGIHANPGFGRRQIAGTFSGLAAVAGGWLLLNRRKAWNDRKVSE